MRAGGGTSLSQIPVTIGHEGVGTVVELGSDAGGFSLGDVIGSLYFRGACCECLSEILLVIF